jgi:protein-tyrosine phosphatase
MTTSIHTLSYIIPYIYQSSYLVRDKHHDYVRSNFTHIINCADDNFTAPRVRGVAELALSWSDDEKQSLFPEIDGVYTYLDNAVSKQENVLIHCAWSVSRSSAIAIYYLMKKYNVGYDQAYNHLKNKDPLSNLFLILRNNYVSMRHGNNHP